jgi:ATP-binding cassette subfamily B protein
VLIEGRSGSGKSTFGAVVAGLRAPQAGTILVRGLDQHSLGAYGYRTRVVCAPQFHENHVFSASLAFNVLMGRAWPPAAADLEEATQLLGELGLTPLLQRMPAGVHQMVGDAGWQLSHGERSRLFLARALLQRAELVILDESLGSLDPATQLLVLAAIERRATTVMVIAHP